MLYYNFINAYQNKISDLKKYYIIIYAPHFRRSLTSQFNI